MAYKVTNNAFSALASSINTVATALTVATGHGDRFPVITGLDYTYVTLEDIAGNIEIVKVSARSATSDVMTIVRGQDNTVARNWAAGDIVELRVVAALLDIAIAHLEDPTAAHAASAIANTPSGNIVSTTVQAALNELDTDMSALSAAISSANSNLANHLSNTTDAHDASAISYLGSANISANNVEAALDELDVEKASIASIQNQSANSATTTGTLSALVFTPSPAYQTPVVAKQAASLKLHVALTGGAVTLQAAGQAALPFINQDGSNPITAINYLASVETDGASWILKNPPQTQAKITSNISGLIQSNGADAVNDINISAGSCSDATNAMQMTVVTAMGKQSDVAWAVGGTTGAPAGGLDTGAVGNNDYYIWLIARSDTGVVDALFSLSSTAPTMPSSYDRKRLIGWIKRTAGTIVAFHAYETEGGGLDYAWDVIVYDFNLAATLTTSRRLDTLRVPVNFSVVAKMLIFLADVAASTLNNVVCPDQIDTAPTASTANAISLSTLSFEQMMIIRTSSSGQIAARSNTATVDTYSGMTHSFVWNRR